MNLWKMFLKCKNFGKNIDLAYNKKLILWSNFKILNTYIYIFE